MKYIRNTLHLSVSYVYLNNYFCQATHTYIRTSIYSHQEFIVFSPPTMNGLCQLTDEPWRIKLAGDSTPRLCLCNRGSLVVSQLVDDI